MKDWKYILIIVAVFYVSVFFYMRSTVASNYASIVAERITKPNTPFTGANIQFREKSVVLFISTSCVYCQASMPFYQTLSTTRLPIFVVTNSDVTAMKSILESNRIAATVVYVNPMPVKALPTIAIVDQTGIIKMWDVGKLSPAQEEEFRKAAAR
jgi:thiol-disulfide isomerase/thioredoxin